MRLSFIFFMLAIQISFAEYVRYDSYRTYRIIFKFEKQYDEILRFNKNEEFEIQFDRWSRNSAIITVPPDKLSKFHDFATAINITYKLEIENLQSLIDAERSRIESRSNRKFDWRDYHPLDKVYAWLEELEKDYENVKVITIGKTFEGRSIKGIEIYNGPGLTGVVIESGIHAREWITVAGTSWVIDEILRPREAIWKKFNYLYFPSVNPDGYAYSWTTDRLWRKTRSLHESGCYGVDGNRNWDSGWGGPGGSSNPCSDAYRGSKPFSEIEIKSLSDYLKNVARIKNNRIYISYHSYGQWIGYPYGYKDEWAPHHEIWEEIGVRAAEAYTGVHGTKISAVKTISGRSFVSGMSTDWYYEKLNATIAFLYEMRDRGQHGFLLPPEQIVPVGQEHYASLKVILYEYQKLKDSGYLCKKNDANVDICTPFI